MLHNQVIKIKRNLIIHSITRLEAFPTYHCYNQLIWSYSYLSRPITIKEEYIRNYCYYTRLRKLTHLFPLIVRRQFYIDSVNTDYPNNKNNPFQLLLVLPFLISMTKESPDKLHSFSYFTHGEQLMILSANTTELPFAFEIECRLRARLDLKRVGGPFPK